MSKTETLVADETFASKLGIEMVSTRTFEELIEMHAGTRIVVCAVGASGIGKTAIPKQVARRRAGGAGVPYVALHVPTMTLEDCHIPTMSDEKAYFDRRVSRRFKLLFDFVANVKKGLKKGEAYPLDQCPILAIEELNRGADKSVTRAIFTMLDDRMVGDLLIPDEVQMVVTMNPTGGGMAVNEFERDPAMRRRLLPIGVTYNYGDFMKHAIAMKFHSTVVEHLGAHPQALYDEKMAAAGKVFPCPATWENVSRIAHRFEEMDVSLLGAAGRAAVAGAVGSGAAGEFLEFVKDHTQIITPEDVLSGYALESDVRKRFQGYLTAGGGRLDKITDLCNGVAVRMFSDLKRKPESIGVTTALFQADLPVEILMAFITKSTEESNRFNNEGKQYLSALNIIWVKQPQFIEALKRLHESKMKVEAETGVKVQ